MKGNEHYLQESNHSTPEMKKKRKEKGSNLSSKRI